MITSPAVIYKIIDKKDATKFIYNVSELPDINQIKEIQEPWVKLEIILPNNFLGSVVKLFDTLRGIYKDTRYLSEDKLILEFEAPLSEIIAGFYDKLKSVTSGYGSMSYQVIGYRKGDLIKLDILLGGDKIDAFSKIIPKEKTYGEGKKMTKLLKEIIPSQLFTVPIQAAIGEKLLPGKPKRQ